MADEPTPTPTLIPLSDKILAHTQELHTALDRFITDVEGSFAGFHEDFLLAQALHYEKTGLALELESAHGEISSLVSDKARLTFERDLAKNQLTTAQSEIATLKAEVERLTKLVPPAPVPTPPPTPPIIVTPNDPAPPVKAELTINGTTFPPFTPTGPGDPWRNQESRWTHKVSPEITLLLDNARDDERLLAIERCNLGTSGALPSSPALNASLKVTQENGSILIEEFPLNHNTRPVIQLRPSPAPTLSVEHQLGNLVALGSLPNYRRQSIPSTLLADIILGRLGSKWERTPVNRPLSERMGLNLTSWTGGIPSDNEPPPLPIQDVIFLLAGGGPSLQPLWDANTHTYRSSGNFPVHFRRPDGRMARGEDTATLPNFLDTKTLTIPLTSSGTGANSLPIPDAAHLHLQAYLPALLTGRRYYVEEMEAWAMFCILSQPAIGADRSTLRRDGIAYSGQIRQTSRALYTIYLLTRITEGESQTYWSGVLRRNLAYITAMITKSGRPTGVLDTSPVRDSNALLAWRDKTATVPDPFNPTGPEIPPEQTAVWNHSVLAYTLSEICRGGYPEALPVLTHVLKLTEGMWRAANLATPTRPSHVTPFDCAWGNIVYIPHDLADSLDTTLANRPAASRPATHPLSPITIDYWSWYRSAVLAARDSGGAPSWSRDALTFLDTHLPPNRSLPLGWAIDPVVA